MDDNLRDFVELGSEPKTKNMTAKRLAAGIASVGVDAKHVKSFTQNVEKATSDYFKGETKSLSNIVVKDGNVSLKKDLPSDIVDYFKGKDENYSPVISSEMEEVFAKASADALSEMNGNISKEDIKTLDHVINLDLQKEKEEKEEAGRIEVSDEYRGSVKSEIEHRRQWNKDHGLPEYEIGIPEDAVPGYGVDNDIISRIGDIVSSIREKFGDSEILAVIDRALNLGDVMACQLQPAQGCVDFIDDAVKNGKEVSSDPVDVDRKEFKAEMKRRASFNASHGISEDATGFYEQSRQIRGKLSLSDFEVDNTEDDQSAVLAIKPSFDVAGAVEAARAKMLGSDEPKGQSVRNLPEGSEDIDSDEHEEEVVSYGY